MSVKHMAWVWEHSKAEGGALLVALALADSVNHLDESDECWPKREVLARRVRLSESQVSRCLNELEELGEIERQRTQHGNRYRLLMPDVRICAERTDAPSDDASVRGSNVAPLRLPMEEPEVGTGKEPEQGALLPDPVEEVWAHYQQALDRPKAQLTPKVRKWIADAIKAVGVDDCKRAVSGLAASQYHRDNGYVGIEYALVPKKGQTIDSRVEMMAQKAGTAPTRPNGPTTLSSLMAHVPSDRHWIIEGRADDVRRAISNGRRDEGAEQFVRQHAKAEPVIEDGKMKGWRRVG